MAFGLNSEVLQAMRPQIYRAPITVGVSDSTEVQFGGTTRVIMVHPTEDTFLHLGESGSHYSKQLFSARRRNSVY